MFPALPENRQIALVQAVAQQTDAPSASVLQIAQARHNRQIQIRGMADFDAKKAIVFQIRTIGEMFGLNMSDAEYAPSVPVMVATVDMLIKSYGHLTPDEMTTAAQMFAAGEIAVNSAFYGGRFNIKFIGDILAAYEQYRKKVVAQLEKAEDGLKAEAEAQRKVGLNAQARENSLKEMAEFDPLGKTWADIPAYWYDVAKNSEMITWGKGEWLPVWETARLLARVEIGAEDQKAARMLAAAFASEDGTPAMPAKIEERIDIRARVIAQKIAVWVKVLGLPLPTPKLNQDANK